MEPQSAPTRFSNAKEPAPLSSLLPDLKIQSPSADRRAPNSTIYSSQKIRRLSPKNCDSAFRNARLATAQSSNRSNRMNCSAYKLWSLKPNPNRSPSRSCLPLPIPQTSRPSSQNCANWAFPSRPRTKSCPSSANTNAPPPSSSTPISRPKCIPISSAWTPLSVRSARAFLSCSPPEESSPLPSPPASRSAPSSLDPPAESSAPSLSPVPPASSRSSPYTWAAHPPTSHSSILKKGRKSPLNPRSWECQSPFLCSTSIRWAQEEGLWPALIRAAP